MGNSVVCFIPCCKSKTATGRIEGEGRGLTLDDLPNTWNLLLRGRNGMHRIADKRNDVYIDLNSPETSAIRLYAGAFYSQFNLNEIIQEVQASRLRLIIISAWYGIVDAFEPLHRYEAQMKGEIARHWRDHRLDRIISDLLLTLKPSSVFGFFTGPEHWSGPHAKYRYFFATGLSNALSEGLGLTMSGCFHIVSGLWPLAALGRTFSDFLRSGFSGDFVSDIAENGRVDGEVGIGFKGLI
ncbi:MAG: hypothetical protein OEY31_04720 [Candidatus Bathyarchaeota archaeon]|nr:hypothetical protein [Candidatus Bathyarchaeota archaeon]